MKVEPITDVKDIKSIKKFLSDNARDKLLFVMGINTGLRVGDLLGLKVRDVKYVKVGDRVLLKEKKTGKENVFMVNKEIKDSIDSYLGSIKPKDEHFLFKSRKGSNSPLTTCAVTKYVKFWCESINLHINAGAHTLRKTWCYQKRKQGVPWELISKRLNHSTPSTTRLYMGVKEDEIEKILLESI